MADRDGRAVLVVGAAHAGFQLGEAGVNGGESCVDRLQQRENLEGPAQEGAEGFHLMSKVWGEQYFL